MAHYQCELNDWRKAIQKHLRRLLQPFYTVEYIFSVVSVTLDPDCCRGVLTVPVGDSTFSCQVLIGRVARIRSGLKFSDA
jgi:hypothetical protein